VGGGIVEIPIFDHGEISLGLTLVGCAWQWLCWRRCLLVEDWLSVVKAFGLVFSDWTMTAIVRVRIMSSLEALSLESLHRDPSFAMFGSLL